MLTSHPDVLPAILGIVGINTHKVQEELKKYYIETRKIDKKQKL